MSSILGGFGDKNVNQKLAISFYNPFKMERALLIPADSHIFHRRHTQLTRRLALYTYT